MVVPNEHVWVLLLFFMESYKCDRKRKLQTWVVLFALELVKRVVVLMPSRPKYHNCGAISKMFEMCLIVLGFMIQYELN